MSHFLSNLWKSSNQKIYRAGAPIAHLCHDVKVTSSPGLNNNNNNTDENKQYSQAMTSRFSRRTCHSWTVIHTRLTSTLLDISPAAATSSPPAEVNLIHPKSEPMPVILCTVRLVYRAYRTYRMVDAGTRASSRTIGYIVHTFHYTITKMLFEHSARPLKRLHINAYPKLKTEDNLAECFFARHNYSISLQVARSQDTTK